MWELIARIVSKPRVAVWLINRAKRTPYTHLEGYMGRWWLFNAYQDASGLYVKRNWFMGLLPSVRIHHILRADTARHHHNHPWNARSIILLGWYWERKPVWQCRQFEPGDTNRLKHDEYHRIIRVAPGGCWTLFITWKYRGVWGFLVNGVKIPWREYLEKYKP